jgi:NTP pyrophosphatase (non-canonical NTP hydrolase)
MNLIEYQKRTHETAMFPKEPTLALSYLTLGLCSEIAELFELFLDLADPAPETVISELGDICWYVAEIASLHGIELRSNVMFYPAPKYTDSFGDGMARAAGRIAGKAKKVIRDGTPMDPTFVHENLGEILRLVRHQASSYSLPIEVVLSTNIAKLADRKNRGVIQGSGDNR